MSLGARLAEFRKSLGLDQAQMADRLGVKLRTYQGYERNESEPQFSFLAGLVSAGADPSWLLGGEAVAPGGEQPPTNPWSRFSPDAELMGRLTDMIAKVYSECRIPVSMVDIGRLSAEKYNEIAGATDDAAERFTMVKLVGAQLRKDLLAAEPGSGKRSA